MSPALAAMSLVDYPHSSDEDDSAQCAASRTLKRKRTSPPRHIQAPSRSESSLPPLPSAFHDLYASSARVATHDEPSLHAGRKRAIPHLDGSWPTHIYLESAVDARSSPSAIRLSLHSLLVTDLSTPRPLHISLSQPLNLDTHQRHTFLTSLTSAIRRSSSLDNGKRRCGHEDDDADFLDKRVVPFTTRLGSLDWAANDSRTRWFLVLRVLGPDGDQLNRLLYVCNKVSRDFGFEQLYASEPAKIKHRQSRPLRQASAETGASGLNQSLPPDYGGSFHFSIAWTLEEPPADSLETPAMQEHESEAFKKSLSEIAKMKVNFDTVKVKIGNEITSIELSDHIKVEENGILG